MAPFDTLFSRWTRHEPGMSQTTYPREVMEAGWVPELAALAVMVKRCHGPHRGAPDATKKPVRPLR